MLGWLVLNANQLEANPRHPGSIGMVGDLNTHYVYPAPPSTLQTLHNLPNTMTVSTKRSLDTSLSRATSSADVKELLTDVCGRLEEDKHIIYGGHASFILSQQFVYLLVTTCLGRPAIVW